MSSPEENSVAPQPDRPGTPMGVPPAGPHGVGAPVVPPGMGVAPVGPQGMGEPPAGPQSTGVPPASPRGPEVPPAYGGGSVPPGPPPKPARSSRTWAWVIFGVIVVFGVFGCAIASIAALAGGSSSGLGGGDTIAVIPFEGTIAGTGSGSGSVTPESFLKQLRRAEDDSSVKAIVLRVDSPGGTVAASEEIATYVKKATKPVVVSVSDVDASGAYMVSSQADKIVANPGSAVGSIGVIMEIPNASGLLDKVGVQFKVITAGKYKDAGSPYRAVTPAETAMLQSQINEVYGQFIDIVASGRDLPRSQVESMATGWAWTGTEAKKMGLVDTIGTYDDALKAAAKLGHIKGSYNTDVYNQSQLSDVLSALLGIESQLQKISASNPVDPATLQGGALAK